MKICEMCKKRRAIVEANGKQWCMGCMDKGFKTLGDAVKKAIKAASR